MNVLSQLYTPFTRCDPSRYASAGPLAKNTFAPTRHVDALNEVIVSVGAYGALSAAISSLIDHGDEVIIMDPSFDCYAPMTIFAGGVPVFVPLKPNSVSYFISIYFCATGYHHSLVARAVQTFWKFKFATVSHAQYAQ